MLSQPAGLYCSLSVDVLLASAGRQALHCGVAFVINPSLKELYKKTVGFRVGVWQFLSTLKTEHHAVP